jgi:hypothetical protein
MREERGEAGYKLISDLDTRTKKNFLRETNRLCINIEDLTTV